MKNYQDQLQEEFENNYDYDDAPEKPTNQEAAEENRKDEGPSVVIEDVRQQKSTSKVRPPVAHDDGDRPIRPAQNISEILKQEAENQGLDPYEDSMELSQEPSNRLSKVRTSQENAKPEMSASDTQQEQRSKAPAVNRP